MQITSVVIQDWHEEGLNLSAQYKRSEARMVELLALIAQHKGYYRYQCDSLREYALYMWELPENAAANIVTVANKAIEIPELIEALKRGKTTVSKLRKVCPVITQKDANAWIQLTEECSTRVVEKAVATEKPESKMMSQMTYRSETIVRLEADIAEGLRDKLERLGDILSTKMKQSLKLHEVIDYLAELGLDRLDPVRKAERRRARKEKIRIVEEERVAALEDMTTSSENASRDILPRADASHVSCPEVSEVPCGVLNFEKRPKRERVKADTHHELQLRDRGQCTHIKPDGTRCPNRRWLHRHHLVHVADGGTNELANITTLCRGHHAMHHHA